MGHVTSSLLLDDASEVAGVNDRLQLARAERVLRQRINDQWLARGVTMWNPSETYIDADVELAAEVSLLPGTILKGHCVIARGAQIGPNAYLTDVEVGENAYLGTVEASRGSRGGRRSRVLLRGIESWHDRRVGRDRRALYSPFSLGPPVHLYAGAVESSRQAPPRHRDGSLPPGAGGGRRREVGVELTEANLREFADGELHCRIDESIRGAHVFIMQTHGSPVNDSVMEQLIMIDAAKRASAKSITAVVPNYGYARQDRKTAGRGAHHGKVGRRHAPNRGRQSVLSVTFTPVRFRDSSIFPSITWWRRPYLRATSKRTPIRTKSWWWRRTPVG